MFKERYFCIFILRTLGKLFISEVCSGILKLKRDSLAFMFPEGISGSLFHFGVNPS
jgi:hypothetical protein